MCLKKKNENSYRKNPSANKIIPVAGNNTHSQKKCICTELYHVQTY